MTGFACLVPRLPCIYTLYEEIWRCERSRSPCIPTSQPFLLVLQQAAMARNTGIEPHKFILETDLIDP